MRRYLCAELRTRGIETTFMRVIVIGAGEVGYDVARMLSKKQHDVVVIDIDAEALQSVEDRLDVMTILGNGTSASVLEKAGVARADLMVAVAAIDEVNVIACMMADRLGVKTTVARIRSGELTVEDGVVSTKDFGINLVIHPEDSASAEIVRLIKRSSATDVISFCDERLQIIGMRLDVLSPVLEMDLDTLVESNPTIPFRIVAIARGIRTIVPTGKDKLRYNDQVFVVARPKNVPQIIKMMGKKEGKLHEVMILGGGAIGEKVAAQLSKLKTKKVKLIEPNAAEAERLAERLDNVLVLKGQGTDIDLLATEGLAEMDAFVAVQDDEESNLVTCLLAKHLGVKKTVALLSKGAYIPISQSIGLDAAVNAKLAVSQEILQYLRGKHVLSVASIPGIDAEMLEIIAQPGSRIVGKPLNDVKIPRGILVGAKFDGKKAQIATGDTVIEAGSSAYVFVMQDKIREAEKLFAS